ncbi:MAG: hypothetical protein KAS36_01565 [Anaerolineales bacterium]|nr:hypothetical protein [Anaerolineales bacterium]
MLLEKIDAATKSFTLRFSDSDVVSVLFGADRWGYNEMRVEVSKKEPATEPHEPDTLIEKFMISYHWNPELEETPAFVMDMMSLLHKLGKVKGALEVEETEEVAEIVEDVEEEVVEEIIEETEE